MSDENSDPCHYDPFYHDNQGARGTGFSFFGGGDNASSIHSPMMMMMNPPQQNPHGGFDPSSYMASFTEFFHGSSMDYSSLLPTSFDMSCSSSEVICPIDQEEPTTKKGGCLRDSAVGTSENNHPLTPNSSVSSSSTEATTTTTAKEDSSGKCKKDDQQQQSKECGGDDEMSKKVNIAKKKGEKRQREPRFAFVTKSEIDNLEDGYRWRKYGQKAVKNSPYPRSYYRCTSQKCGVKKRVERSFQDPSTVVTTYEGQHNHHCPATLRGNAAAMLSPSLFTSSPAVPGFPQELLAQMLPSSHMIHTDHHQNTASYYRNTTSSQLMQLQLPDYGLLQDMVPSYNIPKQDT